MLNFVKQSYFKNQEIKITICPKHEVFKTLLTKLSKLFLLLVAQWFTSFSVYNPFSAYCKVTLFCFWALHTIILPLLLSNIFWPIFQVPDSHFSDSPSVFFFFRFWSCQKLEFSGCSVYLFLYNTSLTKWPLSICLPRTHVSSTHTRRHRINVLPVVYVCPMNISVLCPVIHFCLRFILYKLF